MTPTSNGQVSIIRTERGLTIARTRITLYDVIDYLKAQYPPSLFVIRSILRMVRSMLPFPILKRIEQK